MLASSGATGESCARAIVDGLHACTLWAHAVCPPPPHPQLKARLWANMGPAFHQVLFYPRLPNSDTFMAFISVADVLLHPFPFDGSKVSSLPACSMLCLLRVVRPAAFFLLPSAGEPVATSFVSIVLLPNACIACARVSLRCACGIRLQCQTAADGLAMGIPVVTYPSVRAHRFTCAFYSADGRTPTSSPYFVVPSANMTHRPAAHIVWCRML
jgi:hypothetical protein